MSAYVRGDVIDVWRVETQLGAGGMGSVYRCHNRDAPKIKAAIKVLEDHLRDRAEARTRFVREAEILFQLDNPHIVKVRNVRLDASPPYIEMEFVDGRSLKSLLEEGALTLPRALMFMEQMCRAVAYLHKVGIRHRDIKPANVLIRRDSRLTLVDFGLASDGSRVGITGHGAMIGTVAYAPPEWVRPELLNPEAWDIYSMGVVFCEMITGRPAFPAPAGGGPRQHAVTAMQEKQRIECLDPGEVAPQAVRDLIGAMTNRDPAARPQTSEEVHQRVRRTLVSQGVDVNALVSESADLYEQRVASGEILGDESWAHAPEGLQRIPGRSLDGGPAPARSKLRTPVSLEIRARHRARSRRITIALVVFIVAVAILVQFWLLRPTTLDEPRPAVISLTGVPDYTEVGVRVAGLEPDSSEGLRHRFEALPLGEVQIDWVAGRACASPTCPGERCRDWCETGTMTFEIPPGEVRMVIEVPATAPAERTIVVRADVEDEAQLVALGTIASFADGAAELEVRPGLTAVFVAAGDCGASALCVVRGDCPETCRVAKLETEILPGEEPLELEMEVPPPPKVSVAPKPTGTGTGGGGSIGATAGAVVTGTAFKGWLDKHPEWTGDEARASGRADTNYLRSFKGGAGPVVGVTWGAADAFCSRRGGLARLGQQPHEWEEGSAQPFQEWRTDGGKAVWRRYDGAGGKSGRNTSNDFTGFRCAR